jgi:hypothetical protein
MQLYAGRPADQWRGFADLDAGNSGKSITRYNSARHHTTRRYQHRSYNDGYANAEHLCLRREHDDGSGDARHNGAGQCHRSRGNAGRIATGLLTANLRRRMSFVPHGAPQILAVDLAEGSKLRSQPQAARFS